MARKIFDNVKTLPSFRPNRVTATANGTGVDTQGFYDGAVVLEVGTVSGTTPTLDVKLQESDDNVTFADIAGLTFTQVVASNNSQIKRIRELNLARKRYIRPVATIAGTTPSFDFSCEVLLGEALAGVVNDD